MMTAPSVRYSPLGSSGRHLPLRIHVIIVGPVGKQLPRHVYPHRVERYSAFASDDVDGERAASDFVIEPHRDHQAAAFASCSACSAAFTLGRDATRATYALRCGHGVMSMSWSFVHITIV